MRLTCNRQQQRNTKDQKSHLESPCWKQRSNDASPSAAPSCYYFVCSSGLRIEGKIRLISKDFFVIKERELRNK